MGRSYLEILTGEQKGTTVFLPDDSDRIVLGRGQDALFFLPDLKVSRVHALLRFAEGQWYIQDQGSPNGTFVNGERIPAKAVKDGDVITIGDTTLRLHLEPKQEAGLSGEISRTDPPPESFIKRAWLTLVLYYVGLFVGGFVLNIVFLIRALKVSRESGKAPAGQIFLIVLLVLQSAGLVIAVALLIVFWNPVQEFIIANWNWLMGIIK